MNEWIYLDHNATTPADPLVVAAMAPYFNESFGNPSSAHGLGRKTREAIDAARESVAQCLGARRDEIVFTSGGTESINMVLKSLALPRLDQRPRIVISAIEHPATEQAACQLESWGCRGNRVPVDSRGQLDRDYLAEALQGSPILFSFVLAESNTGILQAGQALAAMAREAGVPVHVDAVQAIGKTAVNVRTLPVDYLSFSAHKFYGPKGVGGLFVRAERELPSALLAGGGQEAGIRAGTENLPGIVGCAVAFRLAMERFLEDWGRIASLRQELMTRIRQAAPDLQFLGSPEQSLLNTLCFTREGIRGEDWVIALDRERIAVSSGTACRSGSREPVRALLAMGYSPSQVLGAVRLSLGRGNDSGQMARVAETIGRIRRQFHPEEGTLSSGETASGESCPGFCPVG
jgi:cysteine desulfurase